MKLDKLLLEKFKRTKLTEKDIANTLGHENSNQVKRWLAGSVTPGIENIVRLMDILYLSPDEIFEAVEAGSND